MTESLDGRGQSSNTMVMADGPRGSSIGITCTIEDTTWNQPSSLSAITCSFTSETGDSSSLKQISKHYTNINVKLVLEHLNKPQS